MEDAREEIAKALNAKSSGEIYFTGGGSEAPIANNTWEGSNEPEVHAEPLDAQIPCWSNKIKSVKTIVEKLRSMSPLYDDFVKKESEGK